jgi:uncharacterized protein
MKENTSEKIDIFCHILPPKYKQALFKKSRPCYYLKVDAQRPALFDLDKRFRTMDKFEGLRQVLTLGAPPVEYAFNAADAVALSKLANDEMAELVAKYPDRFAAAVACLPMNDIDEALKETDRALGELNFKGVQIFSTVNGKPLDAPEFMPLYEKMTEYDLPIWIHPAKDKNIPDYSGEAESKYNLNVMLGWPYETSLAMARLVFSGTLEQYPGVKFIVHHCGAMIPFFANRLLAAGQVKDSAAAPGHRKLTKPPLEYFKMFYTDTVISGNIPALMCGYEFFGPEKLMFATDYPYPGGPDKGAFSIQQVITSVEQMDIPDAEKIDIFQKNVLRLLRLDQ